MAAQPVQPGTPQPAPAGQQGAKPSELHTHALNAEKELEAVATGLAQANAEPAVIKAVTQMADAMRRIVKAMGNAPSQPQQAPPTQRPTMRDATNELAQNARQQ